MESTAVLILAAGRGKRMGQDGPKVLAGLRGAPLLEHLLKSAAEISPDLTVVVTGHGRELVEKAVKQGAAAGKYVFKDLKFAFQEIPRGTGDAVKAALPALKTFRGNVLILYGDVPLIKSATLKQLLEAHHASRATITLLSFNYTGPNSYGRIVRDKSGRFVERIVEARDLSEAERNINEFNAGIYVVDSAFLSPAIEGLKNENAQSEYYLTDIVGRAASEGQRVMPLLHSDYTENLGVNNLVELAELNTLMLNKEIAQFIESGVLVEDARTLYVDAGVKIAPGAKIGPNVQLRGKTTVAAGVVIDGSALLNDTTVAEGAHIKFSVRADGAVIGKGAAVGPFAHLRPGTVLKEDVKVGNFVETKNATLEKGAKASHLTYLGDATIGSDSNIGAGTITCNYDGVKKHQTSIGAGVFIGSDTCLVAPVTVGDGAYIGAGSVITKHVPADSLAITRPPLTVKEGWAKKKRAGAKGAH